MRTLEGASGYVLAVAGGVTSTFAIIGELGLPQILLILIGAGGGVGGVWLMTKSIFSRQEARIALLEKQNAEQQLSLDAVHEEHSKCRVALARMEVQIANLRAELERYQAGKP